MPDNGYIGQVRLDYPHWQKAWYNHNKEVMQSNSDKSYIYQSGYLAAIKDVIKYLEEDLHLEYKWEHNNFMYAALKIEGEFLNE